MDNNDDNGNRIGACNDNDNGTFNDDDHNNGTNRGR